MKINVLNLKGEKIKEIETEIFSSPVRKDILQKIVEIEKEKQPFAPFKFAGKMSPASGNLRHRRRAWKNSAGRGISRIPRKIFWRRGTQFYWQGAVISSARGGRRAHPPKILSMINTKKANKKEKLNALLSALALTKDAEEIKKKYLSLRKKELKLNLPVVLDKKILDLKTKEFLEAVKNILPGISGIALKKKTIRAGKGKIRGRRYRKNAGILLVLGKNEKKNVMGVDFKNVRSLTVSDLASNGARLTFYTEQAVKDIEERINKNKGGKNA